MLDTIEYARNTNSYITEYIKFGDAKAGAILGFVGVLAGGVIATAPTLINSAIKVGIILVTMLVVAAAAVLAAAGYTAWHSVAALTPRTDPSPSLNSFPDIADLPVNEYTRRVLGLADENAVATEYCRHNSTLARIAKRKFGHIGRATAALRATVLLAVTYGLIAACVSVVVNIRGLVTGV